MQVKVLQEELNEMPKISTKRKQSVHQDEKRITYKEEGDGFQYDALADKGYCYQFYMKNDPPLKKI